jgi:hypothetical protein
MGGLFMRSLECQKNVFRLCLLNLFFLFLLSQPVSATSMTDLTAGSEYQSGNLIFSDFDIVNVSNVDSTLIDIGTGLVDDGFSVLTRSNALFAGSTWSTPDVRKSITFDFLVTGDGVDITGFYTQLGYRRISGFSYDSPYIIGSIEVGTSKGLDDLGTITDFYSFNEDRSTSFINITGTDQIWVRNTITCWSSDQGYAEAGYYNNTAGPALCNSFMTQANQVNSSPAPEPTTILLFGLGILGVAGVSRKKTA